MAVRARCRRRGSAPPPTPPSTAVPAYAAAPEYAARPARKPASTAIRVGTGCHSRSRNRVNRPKAAAAAAAASATTATQPPSAVRARIGDLRTAIRTRPSVRRAWSARTGRRTERRDAPRSSGRARCANRCRGRQAAGAPARSAEGRFRPPPSTVWPPGMGNSTGVADDLVGHIGACLGRAKLGAVPLQNP